MFRILYIIYFLKNLNYQNQLILNIHFHQLKYFQASCHDKLHLIIHLDIKEQEVIKQNKY